ncbi:MAG TPA: ATP-binding protein [Archangium sp.]|nr:ATP-binding protein [Archangium sp.]
MNVPDGWHAANQRALLAELAVVRTLLERKAGGPPGDASAAPPPTEAPELAAWELPVPTALDALCEAFSLSPFERAVVLLCAGVELDSTFAPLCAAAQGSPQRTLPTFGLALAVLPEAHWSALAPDAPLRRFRLVEPGAGDTLATRPLRLAERVLHHLTGLACLDERLRGFVEPLAPPRMLPPPHARAAERLQELWSRPREGAPRPVLQLGGGDAASRRAIAAAACAALGLGLHVLRAADVPGPLDERETLCRLWEREAALGTTALLLEFADSDGAEVLRSAGAFAERLRSLLLVSSPEPLRGLRRSTARVDVGKLDTPEQRALWEEVLGPLAGALAAPLDAVLGQFHLGPEAIQAAGAEVLERAAEVSREELGPLLWEACRVQARPRIASLAQRLEPNATWEELALPPAQRDTLRTVAAHVRQRSRVYEQWGFGRRGARGLGITALFSGLSGTGKTLAAEVLAAELRLDLYRIDLSQVVDKYIGETEKNLRRVFDAAEEGGAVLLFDEADALFGKRSEVKDSHDRHANIEVGYLLQRMEEYRGLAILTTNAKEALDSAFLRRLRFVVEFPFPTPEQRAEIWRKAFPPGTPTEALDVARLARLNVAGGNIRNIALNAAFLAADAGEPVRMAHLMRAARDEYVKLEKPLNDLDLSGWT